MSGKPERTELGAWCDVMNAAIDEAADALRALKLSVGAEVDLDDEWRLGFGKWNDEWLLYVRRGEDEIRNLKSASREQRVEACALLDDLLAELRQESVKQVGAVQIAVEQAKAFAKRLKAER